MDRAKSISAVILSSQSGDLIACRDNPNYYVEAPVNSIAFTSRGDVYRKSNTSGSDGWVLICAEGGPRVDLWLQIKLEAEEAEREEREEKARAEARKKKEEPKKAIPVPSKKGKK